MVKVRIGKVRKPAVVIALVSMLFLVLASAGCVGIKVPKTFSTLPSEALVVKVVDGDTIWIDDDGIRLKVRYIGIDTPETVHPTVGVEFMGPEASVKNEELVGGKMVELEYDVEKWDKYDRLLAYVWVDGIMVNAELVRLGLAEVSIYYPNNHYSSILRASQQEACIDGIGIWSE